MKKYTKIFKTLGEDARLDIFLLLAGGELCVCELVKILKMEQSAVSHSLRKLEAAGLVKKRRRGKWKLYSLTEFALKNKVLKLISKEINLAPTLTRGLKLCENQNVRAVCGTKKRSSKK